MYLRYDVRFPSRGKSHAGLMAPWAVAYSGVLLVIFVAGGREGMLRPLPPFNLKGSAFNLNRAEEQQVRRTCGIVPPLRRQTVLLDLAPERHRADLQRLCCLPAITAKALERTRNHRPFLLVQVQAVVRHTLARLL